MSPSDQQPNVPTPHRNLVAGLPCDSNDMCTNGFCANNTCQDPIFVGCQQQERNFHSTYTWLYAAIVIWGFISMLPQFCLKATVRIRDWWYMLAFC